MSFPGLAEAYLEQSTGCHWMVDPNSIFVAVYGDPSQIFRQPAEALRGAVVSKVLDPAQAHSWSERFARAFEGQTQLLRVHAGASLWLVSVFPIRLDGEIRFVGGLARETTAWGSAEQELRHTVLGALKAQEFERKQVSKLLHDVVGQNLTAMGLQLDLLRMDMETVSQEGCDRIVEMQKVLEQIMEQVREATYAFNPSAVERAGLRSALDRMVSRMRGRFLGAVRVHVDPSLKLPQPTATAFFHIAEEAVENAVQHASCSVIEIAVKSSRSGTFLEVRDNGTGFDSSDILGARRGLGLLSMEHYAAQAGLELSIVSGRRTGTLVRAASNGAV